MGTELTHLPTEDEINSAKAYSRELARYAGQDRVRVQLSADGLSSEDLVLPGHLVDLMLEVATEVGRGHGISILPIHSELTTQQAANLLNISRPSLVSLLEKKVIPHRKLNSHRRVLARDLLEFKKQQQRDRAAALDDLAGLSDEMGLYDELPPLNS